jgi:hypothetical protein
MNGEYLASKSTIVVRAESPDLSLQTCLGLLNSRLIRFFIQEAYGALGIDGGISFSGKIVKAIPLPAGFTGRLPSVEAVVAEILQSPDLPPVPERLQSKLDEAVFNAYGLPAFDREAVMQRKLRC